MKSLGFTDRSWQQKLLWCAIAAAGVSMLGFSFVELTGFSFARLVTLAVSIFVASIVCQYSTKLPGSNEVFSAKHVFAFWGVIWLGVPGGVILAAAAAMANQGFSTKDRHAWVASVAADTVTTFVSGVVFYFTLGVFDDLSTARLTQGIVIPLDIAAASCAMALVHFLQHSLLNHIVYSLEGIRAVGVKVEGGVFHVSSHTIGLLSTLVLFVTFNHFGMEFGLVLLPIAVLGHAAYRIHMRRLEQKTKQISEASRIHLATVEVLASSIDARDQVGIGHVRRTQIYALGIGNLLDLPEDDISALRTGALLHDIGKLAVPDHILNKPGRLTPAEIEKTKTHASVGASILEKVGFPYPVVPTVKYHHEFWDGSGYPEGLHGTNIPLTARILSIADAYDTLRGARPYRPPVSREEAAQFLRAGAGAQFDPTLVDLFLRNLRVFEAEVEAEDLTYDVETGIIRDAHGNGSLNYVEQIKRANREVFTLYSLARDFSASLKADETLSLFTEKVREFVPYDTCVVYLFDPARETATAVRADGENRELLQKRRIKVGEGATGYVLQKCKPVANVDPALDLEPLQAGLETQYTAMASIPLTVEEKLIGAISLYSRELESYQDEHLRLLETVSRIAADAINKSLRHAETENHALTDTMTGLPNARSLQLHFDREAKRAARTGNSFQVLMLDLDGFKAVNDTFGHKVGDKMLREIAGVIRGQLRDYDFLARYGGDEFVAVVPETQNADVDDLARRIEEAVKAFALSVGEDEFAQVGVSIGAAGFPRAGETFEQMIVAADKAMYLTKAAHKKSALPAPEAAIESAGAGNDVWEAVPFVGEYEAGPEDAYIPGLISEEGLVLEVDETHIVSSTAVN